MANQKLSKLVLPGSTNVYEIDAMYLNGKTLDEIMSATMSFKGTVAPSGTSATVNFAVANSKYYIAGDTHVAGDAYKVVFNPTSQTGDMYEDSAATANGSTSFAISHGDMVIYTADKKWVLIPSGNDEQVGTVTSVTAGEGLSGGTISSSGTIDVDYTKVAKVAHTHTYEASGSISNTNVSVTIPDIDVAAGYTPAGSVSLTVGGETGTAYTPAGSVSATFHGDTIEDKSISFTPNVSASSTTFTPTGIVSVPTFSGTEGSVSVSGTAAGSLVNLAFEGTAGTASIAAEKVVTDVSIKGVSYTPEVTVENINLGNYVSTEPETVIKSVTVTPGTAPSVSSWGTFSHKFENGTLTLSFGDGTFSAGTHTTVETGTASVVKTVSATTISNVKASGTATTITPVLNPTKGAVTASYTPAGTVTGGFQGSTFTSTGTFTPAGTVSQPTFTSSQTQTIVTGVTSAVQTVDLPDITPTGSVSAGFTGTQTKIAASFNGTAGTATQTLKPTANISGTVSVSGTTSEATNKAN